jgi:hypothetical protein
MDANANDISALRSRLAAKSCPASRTYYDSAKSLTTPKPLCMVSEFYG